MNGETAAMTDLPGVCAEVVICNKKGLHARASAKFVRCVEQFDAVVTVTKDGQSVGGGSIMGLMMLAAGPGSTIRIEAAGAQAKEALAALVEMVTCGFGEDSGGL
jgi:phosphocarrier protein